jgi:hypothetical protein
MQLLGFHGLSGPIAVFVLGFLEQAADGLTEPRGDGGEEDDADEQGDQPELLE